jgi:general secretion pathway protein J
VSRHGLVHADGCASRAPRSAVRRGQRASRGFTLLEVVLAMSLLAVGLALALGTLRGATRATGHAEATAQRGERLRAVQGFLRHQVGGALPIAMEIDGESGEAQVVHGDHDKLELVASMPGYLSRGGPYVQTFELVPGTGGQQLRFQHRQLTPDGPLEAEREPVVLLEGIADGAFQYRSLDDRGRPGPWLEHWPQPAALPPLVRLRLRMKDEREVFPELVVAPRLAIAQAPPPLTPIAAPDVGENHP